HATRAEQVLDAERKPFERASLAAGNTRVAVGCLSQRAIRRGGDICIERRIRGFNRIDESLGQLLCGEAVRLQALARLGEGGPGEVCHGRMLVAFDTTIHSAILTPLLRRERAEVGGWFLG